MDDRNTLNITFLINNAEFKEMRQRTQKLCYWTLRIKNARKLIKQANVCFASLFATGKKRWLVMASLKLELTAQYSVHHLGVTRPPAFVPVSPIRPTDRGRTPIIPISDPDVALSFDSSVRSFCLHTGCPHTWHLPPPSPDLLCEGR